MYPCPMSLAIQQTNAMVFSHNVNAKHVRIGEKNNDFNVRKCFPDILRVFL